jgi:hypothetical protein
MVVLVRLVYASTATFAGSTSGGVELEVGRILSVSRRNNRERDVGGMLHYGNGYFFQVLEGPRDAVNEAYNRISTDPRHRDVHILSVKNVSERIFEDWTMKYLPSQAGIRELLSSRGLEFNPYLFDEAFSEEFVRVCTRGLDPTAEKDQASVRKGNEDRVPWWRSLWGRKSTA